MKNITDYFTSPLKAENTSEILKSTTQVEFSNKVLKCKNKTTENSNGDKKIKVKKKKRRPKPVDLEATSNNITTNISLSPPSRSAAKVNTPSPLKKIPKVIKRKKGNTIIADVVSETGGETSQNSDLNIKTFVEGNSNKTSFDLRYSIETMQEENVPSQNTTPTFNAFQVLMNNRNNIIGQNSGGKTCRDAEILPVHKNQNLSARKNIFKEWADLKGASKRKREEEHIEKCINLKMEKRAKRLKKLLQENKNVGRVQENPIKELDVSCKKKVKMLISSESDSSNDLTSDLTFDKPPSSVSSLNFSSVKVTKVIEETTPDVKGSSTSLIKNYKKSSHNNLLNFLAVTNKAEKEDIIEVFEESPKFGTKEVIKIKMFSPQHSKKRTSLPTLNKTQIYNNLESVQIDKSSQAGHKVKKRKKNKLENKHKTKPTQKNSQRKKNLNNSMDDFCSPKKMLKKDKLDRNKFKKNTVKSKNSGNFSEKLCDVSNAKDLTIVENAERTVYSKSKKGNKNNSACIDFKNSHTKEHIKIAKHKDIVPIDTGDSLDVSVKNSFKLRSKTAKCMQYMTNINCLDSIKNKSITLDIMNTKKRKMQDCQPVENLKIIGKKDGNSVQRKSPRKHKVINHNDNIQILKSVKKERKKKKRTFEKSVKDSNKDDSIEQVELSSDSECGESKPKPAPKNIAPIFLKATSRPKVDAEVIEARKKFLLSGVPASLKLTVEKQKSFEEKEYIFPAISHVQQKCESELWNLPNAELKCTTSFSYPVPSGIQGLKCQNLIIKTLPYSVNLTTKSENIKDLKSSIRQIKAQNSDYPVFKVFRHVSEKSGKKLWTNFSNKTRKSNQQRESKEIEDALTESTSKEHEMWTEKYKPRSSEEILGNYHGVSELRKWLATWLDYSEQINARKRKRINSNSESDFESTDCDSRDSARLPGNTMILYGPCGSGKTSAVYAIANELGFNVLEFNASTKRTGKRLLQELQEATQSHQVRKKDSNVKYSKVKKFSSEEKKSDKDDNKKMCILLLEDIDIIFDQDDGFLASLSQLITTSKRPIILTTTDNSPPHVQKFISQYECVSFMPLSLKCLAVWLQIVCLVEGLFVDKDDLGNLLEYNKGDIRKTLLNVQFWILSGGQLERQRIFPFRTSNINSYCVPNSKIAIKELPIEESEDETNSKESFVHRNCLGSFEILRVNEEYSIPQNLDLGLFWWNFSNLLDIPVNSGERLRMQKESPDVPQEAINTRVSHRDKQKLHLVLNIYDSLILTDSLFKTTQCPNSVEPVEKNWSSTVFDSLELTERQEDCNVMLKDLVQDMSHTMVNKSLEHYKKLENTTSGVNMALPDATERRWRANQHLCEAFLKGPIPLSNALERRSVALDYLPALRSIVRSEEKRASLNTKRGNRFRHYLKDFSMDFKPSTCKLVCNVLNTD